MSPILAFVEIAGTSGISFQGLIDEVRIYGRPLSEGEITDLMCHDSDGDGYCGSDDCDGEDADINPGAVELPGNFIDENCDGSLGSCDPCFPWRNHGEYIRCVANVVADSVENGDLAEDDGDALVSAAARSDIGKKGHTPPECQP